MTLNNDTAVAFGSENGRYFIKEGDCGRFDNGLADIKENPITLFDNNAT